MPDHRDSPHLARMGRVYDVIQDHLSEALPVERLAEVAILSPWHFQRVFQEFSGESPAAFVRRLRIERAANLLLIQKKTTVDAVAAECGFGSAELLARHFRQRFQVSPSQWRKGPPELRDRTIRQVQSANRTNADKNVEGKYSAEGYPENQQRQGKVSELRLERRAERKVIYARHFQGYDKGITAAFERVWHWARPRGLIGETTRRIGIGLDNPWITAPHRCRFLACYTVNDFPEVGPGIGTRTIPAGLFAVVDYQGPFAELSLVYHGLYGTLLERAGVEAATELDYIEHQSQSPVAAAGEEMNCSLALAVKSL